MAIKTVKELLTSVTFASVINNKNGTFL